MNFSTNFGSVGQLERADAVRRELVGFKDTLRLFHTRQVLSAVACVHEGGAETDGDIGEYIWAAISAAVPLPTKFESFEHLCMCEDSAPRHCPSLGQVDYDTALEFLMN